MTMKCAAPTLQEKLLERARMPGIRLSLEHRSHLGDCESCRTTVERTRRLARTWQSLAPSAEETAAVRRRISSQREPERARRTTSAMLVFAILVLTAAASAATGAVPSRRIWAHLGSAALATRDAFVTSIGQRRHAQAPGAVVWPLVPPPAAIESPPALAVAPPDPLPIEGKGPDAMAKGASGTSFDADDHRSRSSPRRARNRHAAPAAPAQASAQAAGPSRAEPPPHPWIEAASAMRAGDYVRAERALDALIGGGDAVTRDAARLARAQIWLARDRAADAAKELDALSETGATPYVRERAGALRQDMRGSMGSKR
jgi:hypothetical protein